MTLLCMILINLIFVVQVIYVITKMIIFKFKNIPQNNNHYE
jgi:hypothetical protein